MLAVVFLLSFFIGVANCEDDQTMALVCSGFQINSLIQPLINIKDFVLIKAFCFVVETSLLKLNPKKQHTRSCKKLEINIYTLFGCLTFNTFGHFASCGHCNKSHHRGFASRLC